MITPAQDHAFNRKTLEQKKNIILLSPERHSRNDSLKQLDSGINTVLASIAKKNNNKIGIDLLALKKTPLHEKALYLARIKQIIEICRKTKTRLFINGDKKEGAAVLLSLGASTSQAKEATT